MLTSNHVLALTAAGIASSVLTVLFTQAQAAVLRRAQLAKLLSSIGGALVAIGSGQLDGKLVAGQVGPVLANVLLALLSGHASWKLLVQPQVEADTGALGALHRSTARFGLK